MGTRDQRYDDGRRNQEQGGDRSMTRSNDRSMQSGEGSGGGGNWYGYVQPYRYYGPGYHGVGYYTVLYQGDEQESESFDSQGGQSGQSSQDRESGQSRESGKSGRGGQGTGRGGFAGRGPRGYQRSDERIREDISDRLMDHPDIDASNIEVEVKDGEVTLRGTVDDRRTKRMAEDLVESCSGVRDVMNQLKVGQRSGESGQDGQSSQDRSQQRESSNGSKSESRSRTPAESNGSAKGDRSNDRQPANQR